MKRKKHALGISIHYVSKNHWIPCEGKRLIKEKEHKRHLWPCRRPCWSDENGFLFVFDRRVMHLVGNLSNPRCRGFGDNDFAALFVRIIRSIIGKHALTLRVFTPTEAAPKPPWPLGHVQGGGWDGIALSLFLFCSLCSPPVMWPPLSQSF